MIEKSFYLSKKRSYLVIWLSVVSGLIMLFFAFVAWLNPDGEGTLVFSFLAFILFGCGFQIFYNLHQTGPIITLNEEGMMFTVGLVTWEDVQSVRLLHFNLHTVIFFITDDDTKYEHHFSGQIPGYIYDTLTKAGFPVFSLGYQQVTEPKVLLQMLMDKGIPVYDKKGRLMNREHKEVS
ncbi:STM3941 family protein [Geomicrobium sediminis]|uniref:Uncharacterized protein n=1 Tax=Geomicrobium sediminis TaxID=1347788 RepID=A0ABS2PGA6_9BACL|nr:STM3941 family protein [Geomicrobium sediminis]MBM7634287.1 hypothetical protein [Geomicrobium sediminis]